MRRVQGPDVEVEVLLQRGAQLVLGEARIGHGLARLVHENVAALLGASVDDGVDARRGLGGAAAAAAAAAVEEDAEGAEGGILAAAAAPATAPMLIPFERAVGSVVIGDDFGAKFATIPTDFLLAAEESSPTDATDAGVPPLKEEFFLDGGKLEVSLTAR